MKKTLGVILALGLTFRAVFLGRRQLWTDELMQALTLRTDSVAGLLENLRRGMALPAPLDYFIQKGFVVLFGEAAWALRLHAAILGTLSLWLFYRIGRTLFGERVAVYATALFAFYPLHQHYSQEGRPYALLVFLTLASYDLLFRILSDRAGKSRASLWVLLCVVQSLLLYTSILGIVVLLSQAAGLLVTSLTGRGRREIAAAVGDDGLPDLGAPRATQLLAYAAAVLLAFALYVPWLWFSWVKPEVVAARELLTPRVLLVALKGIGDDSFPAAALVLVGVATGIHALRRHRRHGALQWLLTWAVAGLPAAWVLDLWTGYFFATRQLVVLTPPLLLLTGYGLGHVGERLTLLDEFPYRLSSPAQVYAAALILMSLVIAPLHWRKVPADWAGTAQYLQETLQEGDELSAPAVSPLLEFHVPALARFRSADLDPGPGGLVAGGTRRRVVVCFNGMTPDPCRGFRPAAAGNRAWVQRQMTGFSVFVREAR